MARSRGSLRRQAYAVILTVVAAPVVAIAFTSLVIDSSDDATRRAQRWALRGAEAAQAAVETDAGGDLALREALEGVSLRNGVRVRVIDGDGRVIADGNREPAASLRDRIGELFWGPAGPPTLRAYEETAPPLAERAEIRRAFAEGRDEACERVFGGSLLVCHVAVRTPWRGGTFVVLSQKSVRLAFLALYDVRYPVLKLTLGMLLVGFLLATWLIRRMLAPIQELREQVLSRRRAPLSGDAIPVGAPVEIAELAGAFNTLLAAIAERTRQNHAFMTDLVHELKSPVAVVLTAAEVMSGEGAPSAARAERLGRALLTSGRRLDMLVTQFLDLARAEAGLPDEERAEIDAAELVRGLVDAMRADERHAGLRFEVDAVPVKVLVISDRIEVAIRNVLDNAASFAGREGAVLIRVSAIEGGSAIEVSDTGPGIAPENLPRVFDRFFTDRPGGKGTGLGLALAKAIVEAHGGSIAVVSPPGQGATFTLRFPPVSHGLHSETIDVSPGE
ncbi:two-component system histidine kinase [Sorangium cellulosum So ce56]|uniref:histidine kinase n=1 Tax=Sorangium cellulosum (strain So ce56) TaxID=448385 RepID=A9GK24_SORC5|nr:two-component system histidine kinase [Sorangium cellulosum So ce56]